ncbi:MAG: GAF domain-containing protein [Polyangiaceae bacterium]|nr:GAF domain-containing protein [Polyangiaceae bacterium]
MQLSLWNPHKSRRPPPLWLVTNGDTTVGPVPTTILVRGVLEGLIWNGHYVRDTRNQNWRAIHSIREVRALEDTIYRRRRNESREALESLMALSGDLDEVLHLGLELALKRVAGDAAVVHCFDHPSKPPVTRAVMAPKVERGVRLLSTDPLLRVARSRCIAMGDPRSQPELRLAAVRIGADPAKVAGVAMVPIACAGGVVGMLEIGKNNHPFRTTDAVVLREVSEKIARAVERVL